MIHYPRKYWYSDRDSNKVFKWEERQAWCSNCGTVSNDGRCHCTDPVIGQGMSPDWRPFDKACFDEIDRLRTELKEAREIISGFLEDHPIEAEREIQQGVALALDVLDTSSIDVTHPLVRRARAFINRTGE